MEATGQLVLLIILYCYSSLKKESDTHNLINYLCIGMHVFFLYSISLIWAGIFNIQIKRIEYFLCIDYFIYLLIYLSGKKLLMSVI